MKHMDYSGGLIPYEDTPVSLEPYTCYDSNGKKILVSIKRPSKHESWMPIQADPTYHFNIGYIISNPDEVKVKHTKNSTTISHMETGTVLTYVKHNYIMSLNMPSSYQYPTDTTEVTVKYHDDENYTLTYQTFKIWR